MIVGLAIHYRWVGDHLPHDNFHSLMFFGATVLRKVQDI